MGWTNFTDRSTGKSWQLNQEGMWLLLRANSRACILKSRTKREAVTNPGLGGYFLPTTYLVSTDWKGFRTELERQTQALYDDAEARFALDGVTNMVDNLTGLHSDSISKTKEIEFMQKQAQRDTFASIDSTVENLEIGKRVAELTRDACATILVTGATISTAGGAAALGVGGQFAVLGAGAGLKGIAKYQDKGNVGGAVLEAVSTMVVGMIKIRPPGFMVSEADGKILTFVGSAMDGIFEGSKALVDGESASAAFKKAAFKFAGGAILDSRLKPEGLSVFAQVAVDSTKAFGLDSAVGVVGKEKEAVREPPKAQPKLLMKPTVAGKVDFATAISGNAGISSEQFVNQFVLRKI